MNGSLILADCYPEQLLTKDSRIECLTDMLDEVHLLHDDFVRNQESEKTSIFIFLFLITIGDLKIVSKSERTNDLDIIK